jgi:hypothetical protein
MSLFSLFNNKRNNKMLQELKAFLSVVNQCTNCGILPADAADWSATQNAWGASWLSFINGTNAVRPPRRPPIG